MPLASVEVARVVEGTIGVGLLSVVLCVPALTLARRWRHRRAQRNADPGIPALARFADSETDDAVAFGGGAGAARVRRRRDTVSYGYLAVAEEFESVSTGSPWCTLTVTLPGRVPFLVADHVAASGAVGVPMEAPLRPRLGDADFDAAYLVGAGEPKVATRVLGPAARAALLDEPVQRLMLHGTTLVLRSFDGVRLDESMIGSLNEAAARFLSCTPSFVASALAAAGGHRGNEPLPPGLFGPDRPAGT